MVILAPLFGIVGAAFATMIGSGASVIGLLYSHWTTSKKTAEAMHAAGLDQVSEEAGDEVLLPGFLRADADVIIEPSEGRSDAFGARCGRTAERAPAPIAELL